MEGVPIRVRVFDETTQALLFDRNLPGGGTTVHTLGTLVCEQAKLPTEGRCLLSMPNVGLQSNVPLLAYYPNVGPGGEIKLVLAIMRPEIVFVAPPQQQQQQQGPVGAGNMPRQPFVVAVAGQHGVNKDLAVAVAKNIYEAAKMKEEDLVPLLATCSENTLRELSLLKFTKGKKNKRGGGKKDNSDLMFTKFYGEILADMNQCMLGYDGDSMVEVSVFVDPNLSLAAFFAAQQQQQKNLSEVELVCEYVRNAEAAVCGARRISIINYITLGRRLEVAFQFFEARKGSPEMKAKGIATWPQFLRFIGETYTADYAKKLRTVSVLADQYPNISLISCCGIGELTLYAKRLLDYLDAFPDEAVLWRQDSQRNFAWNRRTTVIMGEENVNKIRCSKFVDHGKDESYEAWNGRREGVTRQYITRLEEEAEKEADAKEKQSDETQKTKDKMDSINK
jgi:hypothetical protein